jgi:hypothetical protein
MIDVWRWTGIRAGEAIEASTCVLRVGFAARAHLLEDPFT